MHHEVEVKTSGVERVHQESTASFITRQLRDGIMYGRLAPGRQLSEVALAQEFGVSRGPLREAMQRLVQEGLLLAEPYRGLFVKELGVDDVEDLYTARSAVEIAAGRLIINRNNSQSVAALFRACESMQEHAEHMNLPALADHDLAFHEVLVETSGSERLMRMHQTLMVETRMCLTALQGTYGDPAELVHEHRIITETIAAGDEVGFVEASEKHMREALIRLTGYEHPPG